MTDPDSPAVLVTGATGQIGRSVVARLRASEIPIVALSRHARPSEPGLAWIDGNLTREPVTFGAARIDRVVHATGLWLLPRHLRALHGLGVKRIIAFGSTSIYGKAESRSAFEQHQKSMLVEAEQRLIHECENLDIAWTILRPTLTYGAGVDKNISSAARFIQRFGFFPVAASAGGLRQPVHADDLGAAAIAALEAPVTAGRAYDLGGGETLAYRDMIGRIFDVLGRPRRMVPVPFLGHLAGAWGRMSRNPVLNAETVGRMSRDLVHDRGDAARDFGYAPRRFLANGRRDLGL